MNTLTMRELTKFAIGGGWGAEELQNDTNEVTVIRGADFPAAALQDISSAPIRFEKSSRIPNRVLNPGDIVLEVSGGTKDRPTGRTIFITQKMVNDAASPLIPASFCRRLAIDTEKAEPHFVYYWLQNMYATGQTWNYQNRSTGIANFQFEQFLDREAVRLPNRQEQLKIAHLLGALDDKLAANQRTIRDCESLSEALFRKTSATADTTTLGKELELHYGKALPKKSRIPGKVAVVGSGGISGFHNEMLLDGPSIIVGRKGTIGTVHWISGPNYPIDTTFWVESKRLPLELLYFLLKSCDFASMNTDSAVPGLNRKNAYQVAVPWISEDSASEIGPLLKTLRARQEHARKENQILARTRDELLPLLMSGRITVGEAEDAADEAASES